MWKKIKQRSLQKQTERSLLARDVTQRNSPMRSLGFLVDSVYVEDREKLQLFARELGLSEKNVKIMSFASAAKNGSLIGQNQVTESDFSIRGQLNNADAREFIDFPFDVLVGYFHGKNKYLNSLISRSAAKFKIGFYESDVRLFDLVLGTSLEDFANSKKEMEKYLRILKKM